jgi:hypothetical protein
MSDDIEEHPFFIDWASQAATAYLNAGGCGCRSCLDANEIAVYWMITCKVCGNKRCPHATNCQFLCTGSNEPGQPGSDYE